MKLGHQTEMWIVDTDLIINKSKILNVILSYYLESNSSSIRITRDKYGKPRLLDNEIHFNLSKRENLNIYAFSRNRPMGVDLECIGQITNLIKFSSFIFDKSYLKYILSSRKEQRLKSFYKYWTLYEAYGKFVGDGLRTVLKKPSKNELKKYFKFHFEPKTGFIATLVSQKKSKIVIHHTQALLKLMD